MIEVTGQPPTGPQILTDEVTVITAHPGPVNCVAAARLGSGRVVLATAGGDGTLRRFDAGTGQLLGEALGSQNRRMLSVAAATLPDGRVILAAGGDDGIVRRVDAATGRRVGSGMTGHSGTVWSVAAATLPDGRVVLVTGGNDRTVRLFDAASGRPIGEPLTGHTDWVRSVATAILPNGRVLIATGSDDGTVRRFDAQTGDQLGEPLTGHNDWVRCVVLAELPDGSIVLASGGGDGAVHRYDALTGQSLGDPLANDTRRVLSLATARLPDGGLLLLTGGGDGAVRCFDAATGDPVGGPLRRHQDAVLSVTAAQMDDDRVILASAGADGTLALSAIAPGARPSTGAGATLAPRPRPAADDLADDELAVDPVGAAEPGDPVEPGDPADRPEVAGPIAGPAVDRVGAIALVDSVGGPDGLGRDLLAAHLHGMLGQLTAGQDAGTAVLHVDGRPGAGKSTVIGLLRRRLLAAPAAGGEPAGLGALRHPVVVEYDAWRERAAGPPAVTITRALDREVRRQRAGITGVLMTCLGTTRLAGRSALVLGPVAALAVLAGLGLSLRRGGLWSARGGVGAAAVPVLETLGVLAVLTVVAAIAICWSAAGFGRLGRTVTGERPGEVAAAIARLRRWTPRRTRSQRLADTVFGLCVLLALAWCAALLISSADARSSAADGALWLAGQALALLVATVGAAVVAGLWDWTADGGRRVVSRGRPDSPGPARAPRLVIVLLTAVGLFAAFAANTPDPVLRVVSWHPELWTLAVLVVLGWLFAAWTSRALSWPRRPLMLVVDHLDRCPADHVVAVLETVHTLLRQPATPRLWRRWRAPAALIVLVPADGRWLRAAVEERYAGFDGLSSAVRGLGADFAQTVFDHTLLVPQLSGRQLRAYAQSLLSQPDATTGQPPRQKTSRGLGPVQAGTGRAPSLAALAPRLRRSWVPTQRAGGAGPEPGPVPGSAPGSAPGSDRAGTETAPEQTTLRTHHLLERYADLLPANPRMVKRVANTWGMLLALQAHLGHTEGPDILARAAIVFVRFPALVDVLLSAASVPHADPALTGHERSASPWLRPDVQEVLLRPDGTVVELERIARCYGRDVTAPRTQQVTLP
jgi:WD40 repeat protein